MRTMVRSAVVTPALALAWIMGAVGASAQQALLFSDDFETGDTAGWWAPARVGETGQVTCWDGSGAVTPCTGTGQDGEVRSGVAWPAPRFVDNLDGTVTDALTGVVWLKNANCFGSRTWATALADAASLANGSCGLTDASMPGEWRLPTVNELQSLIDYECSAPALANAAGTAAWSEGDAFSGVQSGQYWSSTSDSTGGQSVWTVDLGSGSVETMLKSDIKVVWPMRTPLPSPRAQIGYGDCANHPEEDACLAGELCIVDGDPVTAAVCSEQSCASESDCPTAPATGDASRTCEDVTGDTVPECWLSCGSGETCPDGMSCFGGFICVWPVVPTGYGDCVNYPEEVACNAGEVCVTDLGTPPHGVCLESGCTTAADCPAAPPSGVAPVTCNDVTGDDVNDCWLSCASGETCPDGMQCFQSFMCLWPTLPASAYEPADIGILGHPPSGALMGGTAPGPHALLVPGSIDRVPSEPWRW